ncbi:MAG: uroporphyrinogen-III C-methyltransferase [Chitinivibrionales bacterium]|nr:uroporphyrinogen-III C-methyltransferase [Chitinivibrionales bacterium]
MNTRKRGKVFLVGAGPGDSGLITLKGVQCLEKAEVVIYDYLSDPALLEHAPGTAEKIYVGKSASQHTMEQDDINALIVKKARERKIVVRLKGGDPFVFGRGGEECEVLKDAGVLYEVVPGVTAGIAAPAYAGIPVTHRGFASSVAFITGNEDPTKAQTNIRWEHLAKGVDTLVFYMGVGNLPGITAELMKHGRAPETPVAVIRWGTKSTQQTVTGTLDTIVEMVALKGIKPPAITIVGLVVSLRDQLQWFERRPLFGKRIINTRSRAQASALSERLRDLGAVVQELPTIEIDTAASASAMAAPIANIDKYNWIVFTSPNGVEAFFTALLATWGDIRALGNARIASIGPGTSAAINAYRLKVNVTAEEAVAEGLLKSLEAAGPWTGKTVLLPRAEKARDILPETLQRWGAHVTVAAAYRTVRPTFLDPSIKDAIINNNYDLITFSSSSTFDNFVALFTTEEFSRTAPALKAVSIGPITTTTIRHYGIEPLIEASEHTIPGLVTAIEEYFKK